MQQFNIDGFPVAYDGPIEPPESSRHTPSIPFNQSLGGLNNNFAHILGFSSILAAIGLGGNAHITDTLKILFLGSLIEAGRRFFGWLIERFTFKYTITACFTEGDPAYEWIILFLTEKKVWDRSRNFWVNSKTSARKWGIVPGQDKQENRNLKGNDEEFTDYVPIYEIPQLFTWKGYWLEIHRQTGPVVQFHNSAIPTRAASLHLTIYSYDMSVLKSLVDEARQRYIEASKPNVVIHSYDPSKGGVSGFSWNKVKSKARRPLSSIILPQGELESLVSDAQDFLKSEEWYVDAGIPHRRGYLLYGPPGTGKSSTIYALASELGLEIYTLSLASYYVDDSTLRVAVASIPKRCIFLIEDIDCAFPSREDEEEVSAPVSFDNMGLPFRKSRRPEVTMSGLLNLIDGVDSEEGKFFIATTNYVDRLDSALLRPGRIDRKIRYSLADSQQIHALFLRFFPESRFGKDMSSLVVDFCAGIPSEEFSIAELQGYLLSCKKSPLNAVVGIKGWITNELDERKAKELREAERQAKLKLKAS